MQELNRPKVFRKRRELGLSYPFKYWTVHIYKRKKGQGERNLLEIKKKNLEEFIGCVGSKVGHPSVD